MSKWRILCGVLACLALLACSKAETVAVSDAGKAASGDSQEYVRFVLGGEIEYLDPALASDTTSAHIIRPLFEGLTSFHPEGTKIVPAGATHWDVSKDGLTYTFHLRKNAKWTDGKPVVAADYEYGWKHRLNPETAAGSAFLLFGVKNATAYNKGEIKDATQVGVKALNDYTFQVTLEKPAPYFAHQTRHMMFTPMRRDVVEQYGPKWTYPENIVSNGPFMLKSRTEYKSTLVVKSPTYWDADTVQLAGVEFLPVEDRETGVRIYDADEADFVWYLPPMSLPKLMTRDDYMGGMSMITYYYEFNVEQPPLDNVKVRQALASAVDRDALCNKYLQGTKIPSYSMVPSEIDGYPNAKGWDFNPERAQALLAEAGYPNGEGIPEITLKYNTDERHKVVAQIMQQMWKEHLGITVKLQNEEWKSYLKSKKAGDFQVARSGWWGDYPDANNFLELYSKNSTYNLPRYNNPEFDALLEKASVERDPKKRIAYLVQAEELILHDAPVLPLFYRPATHLVKSRVKGFTPHVEELVVWKHVSLESDDQVVSN